VTVPDTFQDSPRDSPAPTDREPRTLRVLGAEAALALLLIAVCALLGLLMGQFWHWLAPQVPMHADSSAVYLNDPEGEQAIGADGTFALIGVGFGLVTGAAAYLATRSRQGGVGVAVGLAVGGLLGGWIAWGGGQSAKAYQSAVLKLAKSFPTGHTFYGPLQLTTKAVLLIWPILALVALLALTGVFSPRPRPPAPAENDPEAGAGTAPETPSRTTSQTPAQDGPETR
jgi:hypothetical protein